MNKHLTICLALSCSLLGCQPVYFTPDEHFSFVVEDLSTGYLDQTVTIDFVAVCQSNKALVNSKREVLETFEVKTGELQHHTFHPKLSDQWNYQLELPEWKPTRTSYDNRAIYELYSPITRVIVDPAADTLHRLSIVPSAVLDFQLDHYQAKQNRYDSVSFNVTAGQYRFHHTFILEDGDYEVGRLIPHGDYVMNYYAHRDGYVLRSNSMEIKLEHEQDTVVQIRF